MSPQELMNNLLPDNGNNVSSTSEKNDCLLSEGIKKLPPELSKKIYKEYITIKLRPRADLGWDKVNDAITKAPFCEHNEQIVKVLFCHKCRDCRRNGLCNMCSKNGVEHFLAIQFMMKMITMKFSRNLSTRVGAEPLRDIFSQFLPLASPPRLDMLSV